MSCYLQCQTPALTSSGWVPQEMILLVKLIGVLWLLVFDKPQWWTYLVARKGAMHLVVVWQSVELVQVQTELWVTA